MHVAITIPTSVSALSLVILLEINEYISHKPIAKATMRIK